MKNHEDKSTDRVRYYRSMLGESIEDIARRDDLSQHEVKCSIRKGEELEFARLLNRFLDFRAEGAVEKEKLRQRIRQALSDRMVESIGKLLKGERTVLVRDRKTGQVHAHQIVDPKMIAIGLEQYRKVTGLEQRPTPATVTIVGSGSSAS